MLRSIRLIAPIALFALFYYPGNAQECNPKDFTISDIHKIDFSDLVRDTGYFLLDEERSNSRSVDVGGQYGPYKGSYNEQRQSFERRLEASGYDFNRDTRYSMVRTALSAVGAEMYANCTAARVISLGIPTTAYSQPTFLLTVRWLAGQVTKPTAPISIRVLNGSVEGQSNLNSTIGRYESKVFKISKLGARLPLELSVIVDGNAYPTQVLPPPVQLKRLRYVERHGVAGVRRPQGGDMCTDQAYLVSEVGSAAGNHPKECVLCVNRSDNGVLLRSTAEVVGALSVRGAYKEVMESQNPHQICGRFYTSGAGRGSGRFEVYQGAYFKVWEAIPVD